LILFWKYLPPIYLKFNLVELYFLIVYSFELQLTYLQTSKDYLHDHMKISLAQLSHPNELFRWSCPLVNQLDLV